MNTCQVLLLTLVLFLAMASNVESSNKWCVPSSCGDVRNISYSFRLKIDPKGCGLSDYELACEDNRTIVYTYDDGRYYVQSINYAARQYRLVDDGLQKDNCSSLPRNSMLGYGNNSTDLNQSTLIIVNCSKPVSSPFYIATGPCTERSYSSNTSSNWYLYALANPKASDLRDFCNISGWTWTYYFGVREHVNSSSYNFEQVHSIMVDGFVLPYYDPSRLKKTFFCYFDLYGHFHLYSHFYSRRLLYGTLGRVVCGSYYYYEGSFLDYIVSWTAWDFAILLVLFFIMKFVIGMPFVVIFLISKYRRRHLAMDGNIEEFLPAHNNFLPIRYSYSNNSDFGLARLYPTDCSIVSMTAARGTLGYVAPELFYKSISGVSYKADVYSFGMLLMEMASRRKNVNADVEHSSQIYFPLWVYGQINEGESVEVEEVLEEERMLIKKMIIVALWCVQLIPAHLTSMNKVLKMLEGDNGNIQMPPEPLFYPPNEPAGEEGADMELETFSTSSSAPIISTTFPFRDSNVV